MDKFTKESSLHGIPTVFDRSENKPTRIGVAIACLIAFGVLMFYIYEIYTKIKLKPEIALDVNLISSFDVPFPAVTFCSPLFSKNNTPNINDVLKNSHKTLTQEEQFILAANIHACRPSQLQFFLKNQMQENVTDTLNILFDKIDFNNFGFCHVPFSNTYVICTNDIFSISLTDNGFCYTFNMEKNLLRYKSLVQNENEICKEINHSNWTMESGYSSNEELTYPIRAIENIALSVVPVITKDDLNNYCDVGKIFSVYFHTPNEVISPFHTPRYIKIGTMFTFYLDIKVYKTDKNMKHIHPKNRNCYFGGEKILKFYKTYTENNCMFECLTNFTLKKCGCVKFSMPRKNNTSICDLKKANCYQIASKIFSNFERSKCKCLKPCLSIEYNIDSYIRKMKFYDSSFKSNNNSLLTRIRIAYTKNIVKEFASVLTYNIWDGISDLGSLLGFFFGCSIVSLMEIIYFLSPLSKINKKQSEDIQDNIPNSTFHGVNFIINNNNHWVTRVTWILTLVISIGLCLIIIKEDYIMLTKEPVISKISRQKEIKNFPFPALTICTSVFAKSTMTHYSHTYKSINKNPDYLNKISTSERNYFLTNAHWCAPNIVSPAMKMANITDFNVDIIKLLRESRLNLDQFLHECILNGQKISCEKIFRPVLTESSFCYVYNMIDANLLFSEQATRYYTKQNQDTIGWTLDQQYESIKTNYPRRASVSRELSLNFKHSFEDLRNRCETIGNTIMWIISLPSEIISSKYFSFAPSTKAKVAIKLRSFRTSNELRKFSPNKRGCFFENERKLQFFNRYTENSCILECKANLTFNTCGCVSFFMPRTKTTMICTSMIEANCSHHIFNSFVKSKKFLEQCTCLPNCNRIEFSTNIKMLREKLNTSLNDNYTMGLIKFKIEDDYILEEENILNYGFLDFINDFGGLLGLFVGCSILSFGELIILLPIASINKLKQYRQKNKINNEETIYNDMDFWEKDGFEQYLKHEFGHEKFIKLLSEKA